MLVDEWKEVKSGKYARRESSTYRPGFYLHFGLSIDGLVIGKRLC